MKLSLGKKIILATLPLIISGAFVGYQIKKMTSKEDDRTTRAVDIETATMQAEVEMGKMSEAMHKYLLNPANKEELVLKKQADESFGAKINKLLELSDGDAAITSLAKEMNEFDESKLNATEDAVMQQAGKSLKEGIAAFFNSYAPLRAEQNARFEKLKGLAEKHAKDLIAQAEADKVKNGNLSVIFLLGSIVTGLVFVFYVTFSAVKQLSREVLTLKKSGSGVSATCSELSGYSDELLQSTTEQAAAIQESVSALAEMTSMIQQTSENAKKSLDSSLRVEERSQAGQEIMSRMVGSMSAIEQANASLQGIGQIIQNINVKAGVINDIVFKTQLLSFNASIEAARAGQYGKGFAVVAEEVGNLAQMSGNSAKEIETLLADSQKQVAQTLELIRQRVGEGKVVTSETVRTFDEIANSIQEVTSQMKSITDATVQQSVGIEQTQQALNQLDKVALRNAECANSTAESSKSLKNLTVELFATSQVIEEITFGTKNSAKVGEVSQTAIPEQVVSLSDHKVIEGSEVKASDPSFKRAA